MLFLYYVNVLDMKKSVKPCSISHVVDNFHIIWPFLSAVVKHNKKNNIRTTQTLILNGSTYLINFWNCRYLTWKF